MPAWADMNRAMQDFTGMQYESSDQHKDSNTSHQMRDLKDIQKLLDNICLRNPFTEDPNLRCIYSGIIADAKVNVDLAKDVGKKILTSMKGSCVKEYSFKRKLQAITLQTKTSIKIDGEQISVDSQLLFQHLVVAAMAATDSQSLFQYELRSYPPALFDSNLMMREAQKANLADAIWDQVQNDMKEPDGREQIVLDGRALIHCIPWPSYHIHI